MRDIAEILEHWQSERDNTAIARSLGVNRKTVRKYMDSASPMALCLVGQPELRSRLRLRAFEAISQRVTLHFHLVGLPEVKTKAYIQHHLKAAGLGHPLFSDDAVHLQFTKGIPRRINNVATACLLAGFVELSTPAANSPQTAA